MRNGKKKKNTKWLLEPHTFLDMGLEIMNRCNSGSEETKDRRFKALFGESVYVVATLWSLLDPFNDKMMNNAEPKNLLWSLMFLKLYGTEINVCSLSGGCDDKTFRKWVWKMIFSISDLEPEVVRF